MKLDNTSPYNENKLSTLGHIPWSTAKLDGYFFVGDPVVINAAPEVVWEIVKSIDRYNELSNGAITASLPEGELKVNNTISMKLYKDSIKGNFIPLSNEKISVVDNEKHILAWERKLPLDGGATERCQVLEPLDDGKKTKSYIALNVPGKIGFFTNMFLKQSIEDAFNLINNGIKEAAESSVTILRR